MSSLEEKKSEEGTQHVAFEEQDVFGPEEDHEIQYKTLSWQVRTQGCI